LRTQVGHLRGPRSAKCRFMQCSKQCLFNHVVRDGQQAWRASGPARMGGRSRAYEVMAFFRSYGTEHHGRNNASPRCQGRVCNETGCWPDTYWRQPLPHVTLPGSLARPARHLLARGRGRGEVRFRRSENAPRCRPAPLLPYSTRKPAIKL
jgi:hypothetical protein